MTGPHGRLKTQVAEREDMLTIRCPPSRRESPLFILKRAVPRQVRNGKDLGFTGFTVWYFNRVVSLYKTEDEERVRRPLGVVHTIGAVEVEFHHLRFHR